MRKTPTKRTDAPLSRTPRDRAGKSEFTLALDQLARYLALRDHSRFELRTKLGRKYPSELVDRLMAEAENNGWLPPEGQIAERLALALASRHKSQMYIEGQLRERRLPLPAFLGPGENGTELANVRHLVERKFGLGPLSPEDKNKAYRFLKYRGFEDGAIKQVLNEKREG